MLLILISITTVLVGLAIWSSVMIERTKQGIKDLEKYIGGPYPSPGKKPGLDIGIKRSSLKVNLNRYEFLVWFFLISSLVVNLVVLLDLVM